MKNRRNIIESELPPQNHLDIWMKDGKFYRSTNKGWVLIEDQMEFTNSELMSKSTATSGTIGVNKETGETSIYNDVTKQWSPLNGGGVTETIWQELKDKRDNGQLIPGSLYRITDYNCTTTQENTRSAGHQFDIVLLALSENKLAEEGWAMMSESNIYDVTFGDGVTKKCWLYVNHVDGEDDTCNIVDISTNLGYLVVLDLVEINEENKTASTNECDSIDLTEENLPYNYFQNSNLSAWKVWYCLDNDIARFAWADDSVDEDSPATIEIIPSGGGLGDIETYTRDGSLDVVKSDTQYYGWTAQGITPNNIYTTTETPAQEDNLFTLNGKGTMSSYSGDIVSYTPAQEGTGLPNGRGVIYRLIDEWNNDVGYDFKNIQYVRPMTDGDYDAQGTDTWVYTFSYVVNEVIQDGSLNQNIDNTIHSIKQLNSYKLNNIVSIDNGYGHVSNSFISCKNVTIFNDVQNAQFIYCYNFQMDDTGSGAIFINQKKVLTES